LLFLRLPLLFFGKRGSFKNGIETGYPLNFCGAKTVFSLIQKQIPATRTLRSRDFYLGKGREARFGI
jgi:hypothetical protein